MPLIGHLPAPTAIEVVSLGGGAIDFVVFDDWSLTLRNSYVGNWTHYPVEGFNNDTITATPTPGASISFNFSGIQIVYAWPRCVVLMLMMEIGSRAWLYGGVLNVTSADGQMDSYPTAEYKVDGASGESPTSDAA
jgi:hypothetical protein